MGIEPFNIFGPAICHLIIYNMGISHLNYSCAPRSMDIVIFIHYLGPLVVWSSSSFTIYRIKTGPGSTTYACMHALMR